MEIIPALHAYKRLMHGFQRQKQFSKESDIPMYAFPLTISSPWTSQLCRGANFRILFGTEATGLGRRGYYKTHSDINLSDSRVQNNVH